MRLTRKRESQQQWTVPCENNAGFFLVGPFFHLGWKCPQFNIWGLWSECDISSAASLSVLRAICAEDIRIRKKEEVAVIFESEFACRAGFYACICCRDLLKNCLVLEVPRTNMSKTKILHATVICIMPLASICFHVKQNNLVIVLKKTCGWIFTLKWESHRRASNKKFILL